MLRVTTDNETLKANSDLIKGLAELVKLSWED